MNERPIHFPGLNGIRAIAALSVLFAHTTNALPQFGLDPYFWGVKTNGNPVSTSLAGFGVSMFFALSGFLITFLLLEEKRIAGINIRNFYVRRVLRIWPLYYLYLALSLFTIYIFDLPFDWQSTGFIALLSANIAFILFQQLSLLAHYWSLGVEEQFYLFWPWLVKKSDSILKMSIILCVLLLLSKTAFRIYDIRYHHGELGLGFTILHVCRFQCMLIGAIAATLFHAQNQTFLRLCNSWLSQGMCWLALVLALFNRFHLASFMDNEIMSAVTVVLIIGQIKKEKRLVNLETTIFDQLGKISYGIYVLHPLVVFYLSKFIHFDGGANTFQVFLTYLTVFGSSILLAFISYELFEKKFLRLKTKYTTVKSDANRSG